MAKFLEPLFIAIAAFNVVGAILLQDLLAAAGWFVALLKAIQILIYESE